MKKYIRQGLVGVAVTALVTLGAGTPAQAATNPYTPQEACSDSFGGSWTTVSDGHRTMLSTTSSADWGDVYLMYNAATGYNCVATIKGVYIGTSTDTSAALSIQGETNLWQHEDNHSYKYFAATEGYAAGHCVQYYGTTANPGWSDDAAGGRYSWGNCG